MLQLGAFKDSICQSKKRILPMNANPPETVLINRSAIDKFNIIKPVTVCSSLFVNIAIIVKEFPFCFFKSL